MSPAAQRLFVSYARGDKAAALALVRALEAAGFEVFIDLERLEFGEAWQAQLSASIAAADSVLWLVTPASLASRWCQWELHEVERWRRRLLPLRLANIDHDTLPPILARVHLLPAEGLFELPLHLPALVRALHTDSAWIREGTAWLERARQWRLAAGISTHGAGEADADGPSAAPSADPLADPAAQSAAAQTDASALLVGAQLRRADAWRQRQPPRALPPPQEVVELILASRDAQRRRRTLGLAAGLGVLLVVAVAGWLWQAERQQRAQSLANQSRQLLAASRQALDDGDAVRATLLALEAQPDARRGIDRPLLPDAEASLYTALQALRPDRLLKDPAGATLAIMPDAPASAVPVLGQDHALRLLDTETGAWGAEQRGPEALPIAQHWSRRGQRLLVVSTSMGDQAAAAFLWDTQAPRFIAALAVQDAEIRASAFSGDGRRLALADGNGSISLHDARDGRQLRRWPHTSGLSALALDDEGRWLAGADDAGRTVVWDTTTGRPQQQAAGCAGLGAQALHAPADGSALVIVCSDGLVRRLDWPGAQGHPTGGTRSPCRPPPLRLLARIDTSALAGPLLLAGDSGGSLAQWQLGGDPCAGDLPDRIRLDAPVQAVSGDAAGRLLLAHTRLELRGQPPSSQLHVWHDGQGPSPMAGHPGLAGMALVDGARAVVTHGGAGLHIRDPLTPAQRGVLADHGAWVLGVSVAASGDRALSHGQEAAARLWNPQDGRLVARLAGGSGQVAASAFSPDGQQACLLASNGRLTRWHAGDGRLLGDDLLAGPGLPSAGHFAPGADRLLVARGVHPAELWDAATARRIAVLQPRGVVTPAGGSLRQAAARVAFSGDGQRLVTASEFAVPMAAAQASTSGGGQAASLHLEAGLQLWDTRDGRWLQRIDTGGADVQAFALNGDGTRLAVGLRAGRLRLFSLPDGRPLRELALPQATGLPRWAGLAFSPDGRWLAASHGGEAAVWRLDADGPAVRLSRGLSEVGAPSFTPDSQRLLTRDARAVRLWAPDTGDAAAVLEGHALTVSSLAVDPQARWVLSASLDRQLRRWPLHASRQQLVDRAWGSLPRCLSADERAQMALPTTRSACPAGAGSTR